MPLGLVTCVCTCVCARVCVCAYARHWELTISEGVGDPPTPPDDC